MSKTAKIILGLLFSLQFVAFILCTGFMNNHVDNQLLFHFACSILIIGAILWFSSLPRRIGKSYFFMVAITISLTVYHFVYFLNQHFDKTADSEKYKIVLKYTDTIYAENGNFDYCQITLTETLNPTRKLNMTSPNCDVTHAIVHEGWLGYEWIEIK